MLQESTGPDSSPLPIPYNSRATGPWMDSDQSPLVSPQFALSNVWEIAKGHGLWSGHRQRAGLSIRIEEQNESAWLRLSGELDDASSPLIEEDLAAAQYNHDSVVVDLSDLKFMDSSGINAFLNAEERAWATEGQIRVVNVHKHHKLFVICGALSLLGDE